MVFKSLFVLAICTCYGRLSEIFLDKEWEEFKRIFSKTYTEQDEISRKSTWIQNVDIIKRHNMEADVGHHSYRLGMNEFGDMTTIEVTRMLNVAKRYDIANVSTFLPPTNLILPETVNWTKEGYVTPVKNQGYCGSCWAFATTGGLEGQHFRKTKKLVSLSEQNLVDCCKENLGCIGGLPVTAYKYIERNGGIDTEESYPYLGKNGNCTFRPPKIGATCQGFVQVPSGDELGLQKAVASVGPVTVSIDASLKSFQLYKEGVYNDKKCSKKMFNHFVLIVGYGKHLGKEYWLVKNSWGRSFGMDGYIMMARNQDNQCGISNQPVYPIV